MDDNVSVHRIQIVEDFKRDHGIRSFPWPAHSPVLNPIQDMWDYLSRRVHSRDEAGSWQQSAAWLTEECQIPQDFIDNLITSVPRRVRL
jgi:transposase